MRDIAVIDSETDPFAYGRIPAPFIWGYYDSRGYVEFEETADLIEFLENKELIVYAHNGGKFDYHFFLDELVPFQEIKVIAGRLASFKIGACEFRDSYNILPVPLAAYKKDDIDYASMEPGDREKPENKKLISDYLRSDCEYLYELVTAFIERYGLHLTQAGASMKTWQRMSGTKAPRTDALYYQHFKKYYFGGRVECFEKGIISGEFEAVDINSAYPFAMLHDHPFSETFDTITDPDEIAEYAGVIVGHYFYDVECISKGAFPVRDVDNSLCFPSDNERRVYHVTGWELKAAKATRTVKGLVIHRIICHHGTVNFADYINHFYEKRKQAKADNDDAESLFCKLLMNSLYGKFGANPDNYHHYLPVPMQWAEMIEAQLKPGVALPVTDGRQYHFGGTLGPFALAVASLDDDEQRFYNVATAASITGFVRAMLWRVICKSEGVIYCDTDSITARKINGARMGAELGQWEIEGRFSGGGVGGRKLYAFKYADKSGYKVASKGTRLTAQDVLKVCAGEVVTYRPESPTFSIHSPTKFVARDVRLV